MNFPRARFMKTSDIDLTTEEYEDLSAARRRVILYRPRIRKIPDVDPTTEEGGDPTITPLRLNLEEANL